MHTGDATPRRVPSMLPDDRASNTDLAVFPEAANPAETPFPLYTHIPTSQSDIDLLFIRLDKPP
eukprot:m.295791 g.295791  ORF g.295791 m.295791 type:complete len:64 (+) comp27183_c1_seq1:124-315(+)